MRQLFFRLLSLFRPDRAEQELSREINSHLQLLEDQYVAKGMDPGEARHAFGGVEQVKEHQRDARTFRWLAGWPMDLKLGGRMSIKDRGLTIVGFAMAFAIWAGVMREGFEFPDLARRLAPAQDRIARSTAAFRPRDHESPRHERRHPAHSQHRGNGCVRIAQVARTPVQP